MLLVVLATCVCTIHAIAVSYYSSNFDINSNAILFVAELLKACVAMIGAYLIYNKSFPPLRLGFLVNSCLCKNDLVFGLKNNNVVLSLYFGWYFWLILNGNVF